MRIEGGGVTTHSNIRTSSFVLSLSSSSSLHNTDCYYRLPHSSALKGCGLVVPTAVCLLGRFFGGEEERFFRLRHLTFWKVETDLQMIISLKISSVLHVAKRRLRWWCNDAPVATYRKLKVDDNSELTCRSQPWKKKSVAKSHRADESFSINKSTSSRSTLQIGFSTVEQHCF